MPFFGGSPPGPPPSAQLYHYVGTNILGGTNALNVSTGQNNIALGTGAQQDLLNGDLNVVIGLNAGQSPGGPNPTTTEHSVAIGNTAGFTDNVNDSVVIGSFVFAQSNSSVVIGAHSVSGVGADFSVTLGYNSIAEIHGVAIGNIAQQSGDGDVTIGNGAHDSAGANSIGIGTLAGGTGISHIGIGNNANGFDDYAIGIGDHAKADAVSSISIGHNAYVPGTADGPDIAAPSGIAIGAGSSSKNTTSGEGFGVAVGGLAFSDNDGVAVGGGAHANDSSIAIGASASNDTFVHAILIGPNLDSDSNDQIKIGDNTYTSIEIGGVPYPPSGAGTVTTISAAGTDQASATPITSNEVNVTTVSAGTGVVLPSGALGTTVGQSIRITNNGAAALTVYPQLGATIDNGAANASFTVPVSETVTLTLLATDTWYTTQDTVKTGSGLAIAHIQGGLRVTLSPAVDYTTPATGFTYTVPDGTTTAIIEPAGTLATGTINMPATPTDGQRLIISCTQQITALTMSGNGKTLNGALVTMGANGFATWQYRTATTSWYRIG